MSRLTFDLGDKTMWKRGCLWVLGLIALLAVALLAFWLWNKAMEGRLEQFRRESRKVRVGDFAATVRLRLGGADTVIRDRDQEVWVYNITPGDLFATASAIRFDSSAGRRVETVFGHGSDLWVPEDGLAPDKYADVEETIRAFSRVLGEPCQLSYENDSTRVVYLFHLSSVEISKDTVYRRMVSEKGRGYPLRFLRIDLAKGKSVEDHGWKVARMGWKDCVSGANR